MVALVIGEWRSLVARFVRDEEVPGSNPGSPTILLATALKLELIPTLSRLEAILTATQSQNGLSKGEQSDQSVSSQYFTSA